MPLPSQNAEPTVPPNCQTIRMQPHGSLGQEVATETKKTGPHPNREHTPLPRVLNSRTPSHLPSSPQIHRPKSITSKADRHVSRRSQSSITDFDPKVVLPLPLIPPPPTLHPAPHLRTSLLPLIAANCPSSIPPLSSSHPCL
jgi:hypothetical protein